MAVPVLAAAARAVNHLADRTPSQLRAVVGFDGFVDEILSVVARRIDADRFEPVPTIADFGRRVAAAAGYSTNFELVPRQMKLGGNGPIMGLALAKSGMAVTCIGAMGVPEMHPVFAELADVAHVISIANPGHTQALEFSDGKLMLGKPGNLRDVTWEKLLTRVGRDRLIELCAKAHVLALVNWTQLPHMTDIWRRFLDEVAPALPGERRGRLAFFDLADPHKRSGKEIQEAVDVLAGFSRYFRTVLGLNRKEAAEVGRALGLEDSTKLGADLEGAARALAAAVAVDAVVIHPVDRAAWCGSGTYVEVEGPYTPEPRLTTGAGDNFNAGCCLGLALGLDAQDSLTMGVATSGYYVRHGGSPTFRDLVAFLSRGA
ncbi:MAG: hypothetical protein H0Z37_08815 [Firmicutes bacterium]|nr:hypothetical protein [Bacillota bacterium]